MDSGVIEPLVVQPNCQDGSDRALPLEQAVGRVREAVKPVVGGESLALRNALGRVLSRPVISPADVPPHRNSAMDGYALNSAELAESGNADFQVAGTAWAGAPFSGTMGNGQCVRIMTGAKMPDEADTVVIQEKVLAIGDDKVRIGEGHRRGQNVRHPGEDISRGSEVLAQGKRVTPADLGLLASLGIAEVAVYRRPRVAFFTSGDELCSIGQPLTEGQIYDSNRYTLYGMVTEFGAEVLDLGVIPDSPGELEQALDAAAAGADLVLTTGGISVGAADHLRSLIGERGELLFSKLAIKPGRPVTFGRWRDSWFCGLPGNPVATMATFYLLVRPALQRLQGESSPVGTRFSAQAAEAFRKNAGRSEIQRGVLYNGDEGGLHVRTTGRQGSGVLSSMSKANCFILLEHDREAVAEGDTVTVLPFEQLRY